MNFEQYNHENYKIFESFFFEAVQLKAYDIARDRLNDVKATIEPEQWSNLDKILKLGEDLE